MAERVVFDCNVFFQALISPHGPASECLDAARNGIISLFLSDHIVGELRNVCLRDRIASRFRLTETILDTYIAEVFSIGTVVMDIPHVFHYERDPDDEHYVDLAIVTRSHLIVSRDKDLLVLGDPASDEGGSFRSRYPDIEIVTPVQMIERLEQFE